jgi:Pumilio-family RNA binding repeat
MQRTPPKGHSPGRFDLNAPDMFPLGWNLPEDHGVEYHPRSHGAYYGTTSPANAYIPGGGYIPTADYPAHAPYYGSGSRGHHTYDQPYPPRHLDSPHDTGYDYRSQHYSNQRDQSRGSGSSSGGGGNRHKRYGSNDYERGILSKSRIQDFATKIPDLCRDQNGCRHLQSELNSRDEDTIEVIYQGAKPYFADLMSDPFGNYLCQKLLETCNDAQRTELVKIITPTIVTISLNQHGTRAVQKLLEHLTLPEQVPNLWG